MWSLRGAFIKCLFVTAATNYFLYGEDKRDSEFQELLSYLNLGEIIWLQYLKKTHFRLRTGFAYQAYSVISGRMAL